MRVQGSAEEKSLGFRVGLFVDSKFRTYWTGIFGPQEYSLGLAAWPELEICRGHAGSPAFLKTCRSERVHIGILKLFLWVCGEAVSIYGLQGVVSCIFGGARVL